MGVSFDVWVDVLRRHPLKFKYGGLEGFHTDVRDAATHDEGFMDRYIDRELQGARQSAITELAEDYAGFLLGRYAGEAGVDVKDLSDEQIIELLDSDERRWEYANAHVDPEWVREGIHAGDPAYLLKEHPPVEVYSHAYNEGIPVDKVWFICPSCRREPTTREESKHRFYCGLCGAESLIGPDQTMKVDFIEALEIEEWPFLPKPELAAVGSDKPWPEE